MTSASSTNRRLALALFLFFATLGAHAQVVEVLSKDSNGDSQGPVSRSFISGNGRYVVFNDFDLLPEAPSNRQVYLRDRMTDALELVSVSTTGGGANSNTDLPGNPLANPISEDGRYVLFVTRATNIVSSPTASGSFAQLYLRDRTLNQTTMISVDPSGTVAGDGSTNDFTMSPNGEFILFDSFAENLDPADSNAQSNLFLHQVDFSQTSLACYKANGDTNSDCRNFTVGDNGLITFVSNAFGVILGLNPSFAQLYVGLPGPPPTDPFEDIHELVSRDATMGGVPADKAVDGGTADRIARRIAFFTDAALTSDDSDTDSDLYVFNRETEVTMRVVDPTGAPVRGDNPRLSHNGEWLAFETEEALDPLDLPRSGFGANQDVYLLDYRGDFLGPVYFMNLANGEAGNQRSLFPSVSNDGVTTFITGSSNLVPNDTGGTDVFAAQVNNTFADDFGDGTTNAWDLQAGNGLQVNLAASASPDPSDSGLEVTPRGVCADPVDRLVEPPPAQIFGDFLGCSSLTAENVEIVPTGSVFTAGESITLRDGFSVASATPFTATIDSSQQPFGFLEDQSPGSEASYSARFWMNLNTLTQGAGERLEIFAGYSSGGDNPFSIFLEPGGLLMRARDGAGFAESAFPIIIPAAGWFEAVVTWEAGAGNGRMTLSIDRALPFVLQDLVNPSERIDTVRLGALSGTVENTSGSFYLDDFLSWR